MNKLYQLIDHLEDALLSGFAVPLTPWALINGEKLLPLLDLIRDNLPDEIQAAHRVLERREEILHEAHVQSQAMVEEAQRRSKNLLSENELMQAIEQQAQQVRDNLVAELGAMRSKAEEEANATLRLADAEAKQLRADAQAYVEALLQAAEQQTSAMHHQVLESKQRLATLRHAEAPTAMTTARPAMPPTAHKHQQQRQSTAAPVKAPVGGGLSQKALRQRSQALQPPVRH
jgi:hypothetical protein